MGLMINVILTRQENPYHMIKEKEKKHRRVSNENNNNNDNKMFRRNARIANNKQKKVLINGKMKKEQDRQNHLPNHKE